MGTAGAVLADLIERQGPIGFDRFLEVALYGPGVGFYDTGGAAGRARGDFLTSPEVGPLFGAVLARALDTWWDAAGCPDPWTVVDAGAGPGTLARAVRAAHPRCAPALRYLLVERSDAQRSGHGDHLPLTDPEATGPGRGEPGEGPGGVGPRFESRADLPAGPLVGVVVANELLDNLPWRLVERSGAGWSEVRVGLGGGGALVEVLVPADAALAGLAGELAAGAEPGARIPIQSEAAAWLARVLAMISSGRVVVIDYADTTTAMAGRGSSWLRTYRGQRRGNGPLADPGDQDVTCEVALDQLARVRPPARDRRQTEFLAAHGIDELVAEGRQVWAERASIGDLAALRARSRVREAEALCDPAGLGAFRVLEWELPEPAAGLEARRGTEPHRPPP